jgi:hypothetical protein
MYGEMIGIYFENSTVKIRAKCRIILLTKAEGLSKNCAVKG